MIQPISTFVNHRPHFHSNVNFTCWAIFLNWHIISIEIFDLKSLAVLQSWVDYRGFQDSTICGAPILTSVLRCISLKLYTWVGTLQLGLELGGSRAINWNYGDGRRQPPLSLQSWYWSTHSRVNNSLRKWHFLTLLVSVLLPVFGFVLKYLKPKRGEGGQNAREIVKMINSNIIVKMEMNFALSPKCHFMVMNSISMKMSIEAEPQLEQHRISNEYFSTQNSYIWKVQKSKTQNWKWKAGKPTSGLSSE